jgi:peptidoglycan/LPS O-acetylase OafA/YrhL
MKRFLLGLIFLVAFLFWLFVEQPYEIWLEARAMKRRREDELRRRQQAIANSNSIHFEVKK